MNPKRKIVFITTQPGLIEGHLKQFPFLKAGEWIDFSVVSLRDFGLGKHHSIDGRPFGGGDSMVLRVDCIAAAIEHAKSSLQGPLSVIGLCPRGEVFHQKMGDQLTKSGHHLVFVCGRFGGIDERAYDYFDQVISIGKYVVSSGDLPALCIADAIVRRTPGVLGNPKSFLNDSFEASFDGDLEHPQYTKPIVYKDSSVPSVLRSGDPQKIEEFYRELRSKDPVKK